LVGHSHYLSTQALVQQCKVEHKEWKENC
jgi:hypothetical protein